MAIVRVAFNSSQSYTGATYLPLNPSQLELNVDENYSTSSALDGGRVKQERYFDDRPYTMNWYRIPGTINGIDFRSVIATLNNLVDSEIYVNFGTADYAVPTLGWKKVIVEDVKVGIDRGGRLKYSVEVILAPQV